LYINNSTNSNVCIVFKYYLVVNLYLPYLIYCENSSAHLLVPFIFQGIKRERETWELNYAGNKMATGLLLGLCDTLPQVFMMVGGGMFIFAL
jgi:hypothetical protein